MKKVISIPPNYFYFCIFFIILVHFVFPYLQIIYVPFNLMAMILIIIGVYLISRSYLLFKKNNTPENFDESRCIVEEGLYKYSRNPMYLGGVIFLIGASFLFGNILSFISPAFFFIVINYMFIPFEEEKMESIFDEKYLDYKKRVRRWI